MEDERLLAVIAELHERNYLTYGSRRMWKALLRPGEQVGRSRVERLMHQNGLQGAKRREKPWRTTRPDPSAIRGQISCSATSMPHGRMSCRLRTSHASDAGRGPVSFSFVIDAYSRNVLGWQLARRIRTTLVLDALRMALHQRGADVALVHHSDAGSQYTSLDYTQTLNDHGVLGSIGTVNDAYDNARAESFVDSFKTELIADRVWTSRSHLKAGARLSMSHGSTTPGYTKLSGTGPHARSKNSTRRNKSQPHPSQQNRKPTEPVSAKPRAAQSAALYLTSSEQSSEFGLAVIAG
jgi:putative transposase